MFKNPIDLVTENWKLSFSLGSAIVIMIVLSALLVHWWDGNLLLCSILGVLIGWATGILLAPYEEERKQFGQWSKAIAGFLAGFSFDRLSNGVTFVFQHNQGAGGLRLLGMAISWFMVAAISVFVVRTYSNPVNG